MQQMMQWVMQWDFNHSGGVPIEEIGTIIQDHPNEIAKYVSGSGKTPLHWMAMMGAPLDLVEFILEIYPEARSIKCHNGDIPLQLANQNGECSAEVVRCLGINLEED